MSRRNFSQPSLAAAFVTAYSHGRGFLEEIAKTFEWAAFNVLMCPLHPSSEGAPAYPPLTMSKIVLLQQGDGLSDPGAEEAAPDRLSFRPFAARRSTRRRRTIPRSGGFASGSTSWTCLRNCWPRSTASSTRAGFVKRGALVDATLISAAVKRPACDDGQVDPRDPDASFSVKNGETHFGYKAHLAVDEESGGGPQAEMTSADLHGQPARRGADPGRREGLLRRQGPRQPALRAKLTSLGIEDRIADRAKRDKPLVNWQVWFNKTVSSVRVGVERANATMKNWCGMAGARYPRLRIATIAAFSSSRWR